MRETNYLKKKIEPQLNVLPQKYSPFKGPGGLK